MREIKDNKVELIRKIKVLELERNISDSIQQIKNIDSELEYLNNQLECLKRVEKIYENR